MYVLAETLPYGTYFFLGAVVLAVALLLLRSQRSLSRRGSPRPSLAPAPRQEPSRPPFHAGASSALDNWEVQMHEVARELSAQLDSKMGLLEQLIREADRAASRLETALAAARRGDMPAAPRPIASLPSVAPAPDVSEPSSSVPINQAEGLKGAGRPEGPDARRIEDLAGRGPAKDRRYEEIYTLADYGYDAAEIARRVGTPIGEVQLILGLRKQR